MSDDSISRNPIELEPVHSSQILAIGHDTESSTLAVQFRRGGQPLYHYGNVDRELYDRFRNSDSLGSFFHREIKPNPQAFPFVRIDAQTQPA